MHNNIFDFSHNSSLKSKNLLKSKTKIKIYNSTELRAKKKKKECISQRLNDLARPNVRRIRSIFERKRKKSRLDMIQAEKLLNLINEPPKKPCDVKRCLKELSTAKRNKKEPMTHSRDKEDDTCRQNRDFKLSLEKEKNSPQYYKLQYNNSFKPQKYSLANCNKPSSANYNVTNFKVSTEKYIKAEALERYTRNVKSKPSTFTKCDKIDTSFDRKSFMSTGNDGSKIYQKFKEPKNIPMSLFKNHADSDNRKSIMPAYKNVNSAVYYTEQYKSKKTDNCTTNKWNIQNFDRNTARADNTACEYEKQSHDKVSRKALSFEEEMGAHDKSPKEIERVNNGSFRYTSDSGFEERMDSRNLTSFVRNPIASTAAPSNKNGNHKNHETNSINEDPIVGHAMDISDYLSNNFSPNSNSQKNQPSEVGMDLSNFTDSSSILSNNLTSTPDMSHIFQTDDNDIMSIQLYDPRSDESKIQENSLQMPSQPDFYENFTLSLLADNDSSILKLSDEYSSMNKSNNPQQELVRQSTFNKSNKNSDFGKFVAKQEEQSSRYYAQLPVIALRDFSGYQDFSADEGNEILVRVMSSNFEKIYVVRKIDDERNLEEFCKSPVSTRSKLFLLNSCQESNKIEIKKLDTKSMKSYCGKEHKNNIEDYSKNSLLSSINHEKFTVQKLDTTSRNQKNKIMDIHVTEKPDENSNFTVSKK